MDPLAHTLLGGTLAEAGLKRTSEYATAALLVGANLPDLDVLAMLGGSDYALLVRRGWTHGILALMAWPVLLAGFFLLTDSLRKWFWPQRTLSRGLVKREQSGRYTVSEQASRDVFILFGICCLAVWSHPFLDWLNTYGIRLLMPFSDQWFYGDVLFIIDPWIWLMLGSGVVLARSTSRSSQLAWLLLGLVATILVASSERVPPAATWVWVVGITGIVGLRLSNRFRNRSRALSRLALALSGLYLVLMIAGSRFTAAHVSAYFEEQEVNIESQMVKPLPARIWIREGVVQTSEYYYLYRINWLDPDPLEFLEEPVQIELPDPVAKAAMAAPGVEGFLNWARFLHHESERSQDGWNVWLKDLRYVEPGRQGKHQGIGQVVVELDHELNPVRVR